MHEVQALGKREGKAEREEAGQRPLVQARATLPEGQAETHPQEGADEEQVVEVGEDPDLPRRPADERQLEGKDAERGQADLHEHGPSCRVARRHSQAIASLG